MTDDEIDLVFEKPQEKWTPREEHAVYWRYYREMEIPEESQLLYFCRKHSIHWYGFLLEKFPTYQNIKRLCAHYGANKASRRYAKGFLAKLIKEGKIKNIELLKALSTDSFLGKTSRKRVKELLEKSLQWSDYQI